MTYLLPKLPYSYSALEPYIDRRTMKIHHTKHHQAYVDNLNKALEGLKYKPSSAEEILKNLNRIPLDVRQAVINNGGGHVNHTFFWNIMSPKKSTPSGNLLEMLNKKFGSVEKFRESFTQKAMGLFGSGWAFLVVTKSGQISLKRHSFQNSPLMQGNFPILGIDLWEHAYYLKYQNRKADYIKAWWNVINWPEVEKNFKGALK
ncbi:superoxide dismutase [Candidatus Woesebacteria bacterium RIFCSPHIGHO2_01_FULL_39_32]|uniref:Superoxide dismutase n=2 Tax=Candidatus Woeseibacteriota TaxID=1752722 RepID=A0A0G0S708_9BACT|nr:MAG: Superoxide dismutase [Candidatus Woesebacteria bacterium GW2011_GWA1_39_8]OGM25557.1 MAG: superoxide dismutase [Candidatus Woesebacteria bacterium RIFCSPHIGHO2_01_FULL_39_32]OGM36837.1 MAG: superoxide dismutase [Candidatus Woesebacteria bacterium RIFCSPHIGHO2_12_FULL_38_11]OGM65088.1 MAG: superoxide dismutase [Candidatus Woesebacteria bacterium RIFCSPLOWO2_01_FULL_39_25]